MDKVIILGSGAAPGVPTITQSWGKCNPINKKNKRSRAGVYINFNGTSLLVDSSADLRSQLIDNNIKNIDCVLYTHIHADHIMGIDDLRAFTYNTDKYLNIYAVGPHMDELRKRFPYVFIDTKKEQITRAPKLKGCKLTYNNLCCINDIKIMPLRFDGHTTKTTGYSFNDGKVVLIPDYKIIPVETLEYLQNIDVDVLIMPLTEIGECLYHAGIDINRGYIEKICPKRVFWTHMGEKCDYDEVLRLCRKNEFPSYDGLEIEL